jgi:hypothetical protein
MIDDSERLDSFDTLAGRYYIRRTVMSTTYSQEAAKDLEHLRAELLEAQNRAASEVADDGHAAEGTDDKVAGILKRIQEITGEGVARG